MPNKGLFILVEGDDDERLMRHIYKTNLKDRYLWINFYQYSQRKPKKIRAFIRSIRSLNADYMFFSDIDFEPCITSKKEKLGKKYQGLNAHSTQIVVIEIESWYLAGIDNTTSEKLNLNKLPEHTNDLTKEKFDDLIPKRFDSRIDFMKEILKYFSFERAKVANESFKYFANRYGK
jgi:hypothetical protein